MLKKIEIKYPNPASLFPFPLSFYILSPSFVSRLLNPTITSSDSSFAEEHHLNDFISSSEHQDTPNEEPSIALSFFSGLNQEL